MRKTEAPRPAHQTQRQQGGTGEDGHVHLADWTFNVAPIEKKKKKKKDNYCCVLRALTYVMLWTLHYGKVLCMIIIIN